MMTCGVAWPTVKCRRRQESTSRQWAESTSSLERGICPTAAPHATDADRLDRNVVDQHVLRAGHDEHIPALILELHVSSDARERQQSTRGSANSRELVTCSNLASSAEILPLSPQIGNGLGRPDEDQS
jgi:hypothetical protein